MKHTVHVIVHFTGHAKSPMGRTVLSSNGRRRTCFLTNESTLKPKGKEFWLAEVVYDGPINPLARFDAYIVKPVRKVEAYVAPSMAQLLQSRGGLLSSDRKLATLGSKAQEAVIQEQGLLALLAEAVGQLDFGKTLSGNGRTKTQRIDLRKPVGYESCIGTSTIGIDTVDTFAVPLGSQYPVRVQVLDDPEPTSVIAFGLQKARAKGAYAFVLWVQTGREETRMEPMYATDPVLRRELLDFWCNHTHVYRREFMGEPFNSTWREVLQNAKASEQGPIDETADEEEDD
jgi:hypothetical protein